jgi:hypothetical protein
VSCSSRRTTPPAGSTASTTSPNPKPSRQTTIIACRERSTVRTNSTWLSSRSEGTPSTVRIRSYASSGRRGRSVHDLTITGREKTHNHDCLLPTAAGAFVCSTTTHKLYGSRLNRLNWLPFKSALTKQCVRPCVPQVSRSYTHSGNQSAPLLGTRTKPEIDAHQPRTK